MMHLVDFHGIEEVLWVELWNEDNFSAGEEQRSHGDVECVDVVEWKNAKRDFLKVI